MTLRWRTAWPCRRRGAPRMRRPQLDGSEQGSPRSSAEPPRRTTAGALLAETWTPQTWTSLREGEWDRCWCNWTPQTPTMSHGVVPGHPGMRASGQSVRRWCDRVVVFALCVTQGRTWLFCDGVISRHRRTISFQCGLAHRLDISISMRIGRDRSVASFPLCKIQLEWGHALCNADAIFANADTSLPMPTPSVPSRHLLCHRRRHLPTLRCLLRAGGLPVR